METLASLKPYVYIRGFVNRIDLKESVSTLTVLICEIRMSGKLKLDKSLVTIPVATDSLQDKCIEVGTEILIEMDFKGIKDGKRSFEYRNFYFVNEMPEETDLPTYLDETFESLLFGSDVNYRRPEAPEEEDSLISRINKLFSSMKTKHDPLVMLKQPKDPDYPTYHDGSSIF